MYSIYRYTGRVYRICIPRVDVCEVDVYVCMDVHGTYVMPVIYSISKGNPLELSEYISACGTWHGPSRCVCLVCTLCSFDGMPYSAAHFSSRISVRDRESYIYVHPTHRMHCSFRVALLLSTNAERFQDISPMIIKGLFDRLSCIYASILRFTTAYIEPTHQTSCMILTPPHTYRVSCEPTISNRKNEISNTDFYQRILHQGSIMFKDEHWSVPLDLCFSVLRRICQLWPTQNPQGCIFLRMVFHDICFCAVTSILTIPSLSDPSK